jgi:hypothetical protein
LRKLANNLSHKRIYKTGPHFRTVEDKAICVFWKIKDIKKLGFQEKFFLHEKSGHPFAGRADKPTAATSSGRT